MEPVKDILKFCNHALFYDHENIGIAVELDHNKNIQLKVSIKQFQIQRLLQHCLKLTILF